MLGSFTLRLFELAEEANANESRQAATPKSLMKFGLHDNQFIAKTLAFGGGAGLGDILFHACCLAFE
jgi:hypothetical protein